MSQVIESLNKSMVIDWYLIITLIIAGALGGFVSGLNKESFYNIVTPKTGKKIRLGFIGDLIIGMTASFVISIVIAEMFTDLNTKNTKDFLFLIAIGILSGFAGIKLISSLSDKLSGKVTEMEIKLNSIENNNEIENIVKQGDFLLNDDPNRALIMYEKALAKDSQNVNAMIGKARALKRLDKYDDAINLLNKVITIDSKCDRAYYIRACYKNLKGSYKIEEILDDLKSAINISDFYKEYSQKDKELENIWKNEKFINLTK